MSRLNQGTRAGHDLVNKISDPVRIPETLPTRYFPAASGTGPSPRSREVLLANPDLLYVEGDRTDGVSWTNSGDIAGNNLTYVDEPIHDEFISFPGTTGNYLSIPDSAALDFDGNTQLEIVARLAGDWFSEARRQIIVAKRGVSGTSYELAITGNTTLNGQLIFRISAGTADTASQCIHSIPAIPYENVWIKVTWDGAHVNYFVADDSSTEPVSWMEIGSDETQQNLTGSIAANAQDVYVGGSPGVSSSWFAGRIYYLAIRDAIGGSDVLTIDVPTDCAATTPDVDASFTATTGQTVTFNTSGTAPATCRLDNTLSHTLEYPWYEVTLPAALDPDVGEMLHCWVVLDKSANVKSPASILPIVSAFNRDPSTVHRSGWAFYYSTAFNKMATPMQSSLGWGGNVGVGNPAVWGTGTIFTGEAYCNMYLYRHGISRYDSAGMYGSSSAHLGGFNGVSGTWPLDNREMGQGTLRILANNSYVVPSEVGLKHLAPPEPLKGAPGVAGDTAWRKDSFDDGRAAMGLEPFWTTGDGTYITESGSPAWIGEAVEAGDWLIAQSTTNEAAVVWSHEPGLPYRVWITDSLLETVGEDPVTVQANEHLLAWAVVSAPVGSYFRDCIEHYDSGEGSSDFGYINITVDWNDPDAGDDFPYIYFEVDGDIDYQWAEIFDDPEFRVPTPAAQMTEPIMVALFMDRTEQKLYGYASGKGWIDPDASVDGIDIGVVTIGALKTGWNNEMDNAAGWAYSMSWGSDIERPSATEMEQLKQAVIARNSI